MKAEDISSTGVSRRSFLRGLFGLAGASITAIPRLSRSEWILNRCHIAGFQYHEGPKIREQLKIGDELSVLRESENPYDCYAVALKWKGRHLGYVPRSENRHLSRLLRQGAELTARITQVKPTPPVWDSIRVDIFMVNRNPV